MSAFSDIQSALDNHLNGMSSLPPVAWENRAFEPTQGTLYVRQTNLQGDTIQATLGESGEDETVGVYQIDIFSPQGEGKKEGIDMSDAIANRFKRGTVMTYNGVNVTVRSVSRGASINSDGWFQIPITIVYRVHTAARA